MKYTNKNNLPQAFYNAVVNDDYDPGESDITVTSLKNPPRMNVLKKRHADEIEVDVADRVFALLGQSIHTILERGAEEGALVEKRYYSDFDGWKVSGQFDHYNGSSLLRVEDDVLMDYKVTSAYALKGHLDGGKDDWHYQMNSLAELLRRNCVVVKKLSIMCILRDWSKNKALQEMRSAKNAGVQCHYPQKQIQMVDVPLWESGKISEWMLDRVKINKAALEELPLCTNEDKWQDPDKWAVMEKGKKRAKRLLDSHDAAKSYCMNAGLTEEVDGALKLKKNIYVEKRVGEPKRCQMYCDVCEFCDQFKGMADV